MTFSFAGECDPEDRARQRRRRGALGALGIVLELGLMETIAVVVAGNLVDCAIFAYLPSALMFLMTLGWIGVNTYFPVKIAVAILGRFAIPDTWLTTLSVVTVVMAIQALIAGVVGYGVTIYFVFQPSFAKAFDNWMISLLLWMSPWAGVVLTDFFIVRRRRIDVDELYREPGRSAYGDVNWAGIAAFLVGLVAGWSVEDGLVPVLQGPISTRLLGGADLSWLAGIAVAGAVYLALSRGGPAATP